MNSSVRREDPRRVRRALAALGVCIAAMAAMLVGGTGPARAAAHPSTFTWTAFTTRAPGKFELDSPNGLYRAVYQKDHNLVVYHKAKAIWASNTYLKNLDTLVFTCPHWPYGFKGNVGVVVYCKYACSYPRGYKMWNNGVNTSAVSYHVTMQNDGNFVEYRGNGKALWATNTVGK